MIKEFVGKKDKYYLIAILLLSAILVGYYINFNDRIGISCSDVYVYLLNALYYTGTNVHSTKFIYISPPICFLTSIFFRVGFVDKLAIYIVTGLFAIFGNVGFYLLLRKFFNEELSLTGTILYSTFSLYLTWLANGTLDIPATGIIIWIALFAIIAIRENPKYYEYLIPLIAFGFFIRYTTILTVPAFLLLYVLENGFKINADSRKHIKKGIIYGIIFSVIILMPILLMGNGNFEVASQIANGIQGTSGSETDPAFNPDVSYYLVNFPNFISNSNTVFEANPVLNSPTVLSYAIFALLFVGAGFWLYGHEFKFEKKDAIAAAVILIGILSFTRTSSVVTTLLILIGMYLIGKDRECKNGIFMLGWILANAIFLSYYIVKVNRYILPTFPPFIFFILIAIENIQKHVKINKNIIPTALIVLFVIQAFAFTATFEPTDKYTSTEEISNYIIDSNPDFENMTIGVYNIRPYSWWLGSNTIGIPSNHQSDIDKSNVSYYIANKPMDNLTNYTEIKNIANLYLYEKNTV
ncbi:glycosyltransferase family 39 protein [Methanobrevibacter sp.]|uniref:glycosyltransferase family 39 protein n=1 Tax=Methanobrevibacter sp. TaxID=66852 RepID=UPI0026E0DA77|nr:glycosyltransferase family 39 protein [Methanobrevibacter sp.]MDO5824694.1 glycosyltransferase family 39 protein [Methanobrevibacter sp.]